MSKIEVAGLGALNIDHIYQVDRILDDGETVVNKVDSFCGGSAANTVYGLGKLGVVTGYIGAAGSDVEGEILVRDLQKAGVDTSQIKIKSRAKTGATLCLSDKHSFRSIYVVPKANSLLTMSDLDFSYINKAKILHVSSFADELQFKLLRDVAGKLAPSVKMSFSPGTIYAVKGLTTLAPILKRTHILLLNEKELKQMTGEEVNAGAESCLKHGCQIVVVTLGKGAGYNAVRATSYIRDTKNEYVIKSSHQDQMPVFDTTGAGDAFATGFLYGLLKEKSPEECGHLGDIVAQFAISKTGAREGLPTFSELSQRYNQLYLKQL